MGSAHSDARSPKQTSQRIREENQRHQKVLINKREEEHQEKQFLATIRSIAESRYPDDADMRAMFDKISQQPASAVEALEDVKIAVPSRTMDSHARSHTQ